MSFCFGCTVSQPRFELNETLRWDTFCSSDEIFCTQPPLIGTDKTTNVRKKGLHSGVLTHWKHVFQKLQYFATLLVCLPPLNVGQSQ
eukprot:m.319845 g.319845  ORF g.319845 m.319845 type:complete len:87 (+) comp19705_c0_seq6:512-772(+)